MTKGNLSEFDQKKDLLDMSQKQVVIDEKIEEWVEGQNRINKEKQQQYYNWYIEDADRTYPMQYSKSKSLSPERGKINFGMPQGLGTVSQPT